jgi:hypothetical protein
MAKYIQIPTTVTGSPNILFNTDVISSVTYLTATTFAVYAQAKSFTFTTSAAGAAGTVAAIYNAMLATNGPVLATVVMPTGVTISALPVVA